MANAVERVRMQTRHTKEHPHFSVNCHSAAVIVGSDCGLEYGLQRLDFFVCVFSLRCID